MAIDWLAASRRAADPAHRGGDFFDVCRTDTAVRVLVGDVMGHGEAERVLAHQISGRWHELVDEGLSDEELLPALDAALADVAPVAASGVPIFATACLLTLLPTPEGGYDITVRLAGHHAPLIRTATGAHYLEAPPGTPLGLRAPGLVPGWPAASGQLEAGDVLVLYTDGVLDSYAERGSDGIGELARAVENIARSHDAREWATTLISGVLRAAADDSLVVAFTTR